jgi:deoxyribonuclease-4
MPISRGFPAVPNETVEIGGNAFQIFPHNARQWRARLPDRTTVNQFKRNMKKYSIDHDAAFCHSGYLVNLASPKPDIWEKSVDLLEKELSICAALGLRYLNIHPGSHLGEGEEAGIDLIAKGLDEVFRRTEGLDVVILLENVAPKGSAIGYSYSQMRKIIERTSFPERIGVTYDTCHGFDAGYDIRTPEGVRKLLDEIDSEVGLDRLKMIHLNDSKYPLGAAKDRHESIGLGYIGREGFRNFLSFEEVRRVPWILETPGGNEEHAEDIRRVLEIIGE